MRLADKADDGAPYFADRAGAGLGGAAVSGRLAVVGLGPGDARWLTPEAAARARRGRCGLRLRALSRPRSRARRPDAPRLRQPRGARARRGGARPRGARARRSRSSRAAIPASSPWRRRSARRSRRARRRGARSISPSCPGVTAMLAVAARVGAPLGHDFCALSLSDNLKPWELIERRLDAAAAAGFVIALYNPISRARPWQLGAALRAPAPASAGRDAGGLRPRGRPRRRARRGDDARRRRCRRAPTWRRSSSSARARRGSIARPGGAPLVYTPRAAAEAST